MQRRLTAATQATAVKVKVHNSENMPSIIKCLVYYIATKTQ